MNGTGIVQIKQKSESSYTDITRLLASFTPGDGDLASPDSGRTLSGKMNNEVVASKEYFDLEFITLSRADAAKILNIVRGQNSILLKCISPLKASGYKEGEFYVQDRTIGSPIFVKESDNNYTVLWPGISFRLAEI